MGNFNQRGGRDKGRGYSAGGRDFGRRDRQMFRAVCSNCGKNCEVPFHPTGDKPVYCSECFEQRKFGGRDSGRDNKGGGLTHNNLERKIFDLEAKLDRIISLLSPQEKVEKKEKKEEVIEVKKEKKQKTSKKVKVKAKKK
jgi:CxxC-x17-CxxC domain-containing protein